MESLPAHRPGRTTRRRALAALGAGTLGLAWPGAARAAPTVQSWPATRPTPALSLVDLDGAPWTLAAQTGRPVLLNFWASWCEPCRAEMPALERLAARHGKAGLRVVSVNYRETPATIRRFLEKLPFALPILLDTDGDAASAWTPRVFPTSVLIDRHGQARHSVIGEIDWLGEPARALVEPLLVHSRST